MEKVNNLQDYLDSLREMKTIKKNWKDMLELKITITKIKNIFDMFISIVDIAEEKVGKLKISQ